ncbi:MAG: autotransporter-associated beta strand repeat-containing protein [Verrucomicrobia bacterium]|nr:autotransporter-associated beta strand repeat-containing protein [Verrucomicrobiota bacterium]
MKRFYQPEFPVSPPPIRSSGSSGSAGGMEFVRALACGVRRNLAHSSRLAGGLVLVAAAQATGMTVTGYTTAINDRFSAGFPSAPVANASANFAGYGLDWAGVGWAASAPTKGFGFISPSHYLVAKHYGGATNITLALNGGTASFAQAKVENTGYGVIFSGQTIGDLSLGTLTTPVPASSALPRYGVLDLNESSTVNTPANYVDLQVLAYGRGPDGSSSPRVGGTTSVDYDVAGYSSVLATFRTEVQLEGGDSGSPTFAKWTNPNGGSELAVLGNNAGINATYNGFNFLGTSECIAALNTFMNDDGRALRVVGNSARTWVGSSSTAIGDAGAWSAGGVPADVFVGFDASSAGNGRAVTVSTDQNLRGLFFKSSATGNDGFDIGGSNTLTIGRGGITNYDSDRQTLTAAVRLGASQFWDGGTGGLTATAINTNGNLLEIAGSGTNRIDSSISGAGGIALSNGKLVLSGTNTYSGKTWVHGGQLVVDGSTDASSVLVVENGAALHGSGTLGGASTILAGGRQSPGAPGAVGTQTFTTNLTFKSGSILAWDIDTASTTYDKVTVGGTLTIEAGSVFQVASSTAFSNLFWTANHQWSDIFGSHVLAGFNVNQFLFSVAGSMVEAPSDAGRFAVDGTDLIWTPVPEPSNLLVGGLLAAGLWRRRSQDAHPTRRIPVRVQA